MSLVYTLLFFVPPWSTKYFHRLPCWHTAPPCVTPISCCVDMTVVRSMTWHIQLRDERCRFTSFERGVWDHFPFIYKNAKQEKKREEYTQNSVLIYENTTWVSSTEYLWGFLSPCEKSECAWNQPRAQAQTAQNAQGWVPGKSPGELLLGMFPTRSVKDEGLTAFIGAKFFSLTFATKVT